MRDSLGQHPRDLRRACAAWAQFGGRCAGASTSCRSFSACFRRALADEPPADVSEGNFVREGYDGELDRLRALMSGNKAWLADLERGEQERTGIRSLKVRYTNNFGYYIEVTKANLHLVPSDYVRRQTTVGGERYVTEALRQKEREILHAEDNALAREREILEALIAAVLKESPALVADGRRPGRDRCRRGLGGDRPRMGLLPAGDRRGRLPRDHRGAPSGGRAGLQVGRGRRRRRPGLRPERHLALVRATRRSP